MKFPNNHTILVRVSKDDLDGAKNFDAVKGTIVNYTKYRHYTIPVSNNQIYFMPIRGTRVNNPSSFESAPFAHVYFFIDKTKKNIIAESTKPLKKHEFYAK